MRTRRMIRMGSADCGMWNETPKSATVRAVVPTAIRISNFNYMLIGLMHLNLFLGTN